MKGHKYYFIYEKFNTYSCFVSFNKIFYPFVKVFITFLFNYGKKG